MLSLPREEWMRDAACLHAEADSFYPEKGDSARDAKRVCNGDSERPPCAVRQQCLAYGLEDRFGVYGGLSERERHKVRDTPRRERPQLVAYFQRPVPHAESEPVRVRDRGLCVTCGEKPRRPTGGRECGRCVKHRHRWGAAWPDRPEQRRSA